MIATAQFTPGTDDSRFIKKKDTSGGESFSPDGPFLLPASTDPQTLDSQRLDYWGLLPKWTGGKKGGWICHTCIHLESLQLEYMGSNPEPFAVAET